jgi:Amt family ammonium transporter
LFWSQLPWITTCVAVTLWAVQARTWPVGSAAQRPAASGLGVLLFLSGLLQAALYALVGNWVWGGGWLASLGPNLDLGRGFVDYGGSLVHLLAASSALAAMVALPAARPVETSPQAGTRQLPLPELGAPAPGVRWTARDEPYVPMPALHLPVLGTAGAWLALIGWLGWCASTPLHGLGSAVPPWPEQAIGLLLAAAGGALGALLASWLTSGQGNALMAARGVIAALIAVSAGLPFYSFETTLAVGAVAGLLMPLAQYAVDHWLRLQDVTSALAAHGLAALWGLLAVGLWGGGGPGQLQAQAFGVAAIACLALLAGGLLMGLARGLVRAWHGESLPRRVVRPARSRRARGGRSRWKALSALRRPAWRWPDWGRLAPTRLKNLSFGRAKAQEGAEVEAVRPELELGAEAPEPLDLAVADVAESVVEQEPAERQSEDGP